MKRKKGRHPTVARKSWDANTPAQDLPPDEVARRIQKIGRQWASGQINPMDYPFVEMPETANFEAVMEFDRATCCSGLKAYRRRVDRSEQEFAERAGTPEVYANVDAIFIMEAAPGVRARLGVVYGLESKLRGGG